MTLSLVQRLRVVADRQKYLPLHKSVKNPELEWWARVGRALRLKPNEKTQAFWKKLPKATRALWDGGLESLPGFPDTLELVWGVGDDAYLRATYDGKVHDFYWQDSHDGWDSEGSGLEDTHFREWPPHVEESGSEGHPARLQRYKDARDTFLRSWLITLQDRARKPKPDSKLLGDIGVGREFSGGSGFIMFLTRHRPKPLRNVHTRADNHASSSDNRKEYLSLTYDQLETQFERRVQGLKVRLDRENQDYWTPTQETPENTPGPRWVFKSAEITRHNEDADPYGPSVEPSYEVDVRVDLAFPVNDRLSFSECAKRVKRYEKRIGIFRAELEHALLSPWASDQGSRTYETAQARHAAFVKFVQGALARELSFQHTRLRYETGRDAIQFICGFPFAATTEIPHEPNPNFGEISNSNVHRILEDQRETRTFNRVLPVAERRLARVVHRLSENPIPGIRLDAKLDSNAHFRGRGLLPLLFGIRLDPNLTTEQVVALGKKPLPQLRLQAMIRSVMEYVAKTPGLAPLIFRSSQP